MMTVNMSVELRGPWGSRVTVGDDDVDEVIAALRKFGDLHSPSIVQLCSTKRTETN